MFSVSVTFIQIDPKFSRKTSSWLPISMKHILHSELALQAELCRFLALYVDLQKPPPEVVL